MTARVVLACDHPGCRRTFTPDGHAEALLAPQVRLEALDLRWTSSPAGGDRCPTHPAAR